MSSTDFAALLGETLVEIHGATRGSECIEFTTASGRRFRMDHEQDCCERVEVEDVCGDVADLIGSPIMRASEDTDENKIDGKPEWGDSWTWTFYNFATAKGHVTIRWLGESNGYYSEDVSFEEVTNRGGR